MVEGVPQRIDIPDNMAEYLKRHAAAVVVSVNSTDVINGYGCVFWYTVEMKRLTRTCWRCGYDQLWNPQINDDSKCNRHIYNDYRYDTVFAWTGDGRHGMTLEEAFDDWLKSQPRWSEPVRYKLYGRFSPHFGTDTYDGSNARRAFPAGA